MSKKVICLSEQSAREILSLDITKDKVSTFTYWIDLKKFNRELDAKEKLGWKNKFIVLFVGRLVPEKGIHELLESLKKWNKNIILVIIGAGLLEGYIRVQQQKINNLIFLGSVNNDKLALYYSGADLLIVPSVHEEGFGRVIIESLACGTPVVGSKRGAISEAMDETVGKLIDITPENIKKTVEYLYSHNNALRFFSENSRKFAVTKYSENNIEMIINSYL